MSNPPVLTYLYLLYVRTELSSSINLFTVYLPE